jgi:hypothetical protein
MFAFPCRPHLPFTRIIRMPKKKGVQSLDTKAWIMYVCPTYHLPELSACPKKKGVQSLDTKALRFVPCDNFLEHIIHDEIHGICPFCRSCTICSKYDSRIDTFLCRVTKNVDPFFFWGTHFCTHGNEKKFLG